MTETNSLVNISEDLKKTATYFFTKKLRPWREDFQKLFYFSLVTFGYSIAHLAKNIIAYHPIWKPGKNHMFVEFYTFIFIIINFCFFF